MILTKQCKEDFEAWIVKEYNYGLTETYIDEDGVLWQNGRVFYTIPLSMQWGLLDDFFESVNIEIVVRKREGKYNWFAGESVKNFEVDDHESKDEARKKAIEKANELYNNTNK